MLPIDDHVYLHVSGARQIFHRRTPATPSSILAARSGLSRVGLYGQTLPVPVRHRDIHTKLDQPGPLVPIAESQPSHPLEMAPVPLPPSCAAHPRARPRGPVHLKGSSSRQQRSLGPELLRPYSLCWKTRPQTNDRVLGDVHHYASPYLESRYD